MIIRNFKDLATSDRRRDCLEILEAGLAAANPDSIIPEFVTPDEIRLGKRSVKIGGFSSVYSVAFGKAGDSMTRALNSIIPIKSGIVVIPKGSRSRIKGRKFQIFNSRHPKPDQTSVKAAKKVMKFLQNRKSDELVVFLVSGGGSSLLALPDGISLDDKIHVTDLLLKSGATIQEFNCVRKHLSKIKGGRMVRDLKCQAVSLIMSDVEGDDLSAIASGTTYMDDTTYADALGIIEKYGLERKMPINVMRVLEKGARTGAETPKKAEIENHIIANNDRCLDSMGSVAKKLGYEIVVMRIFGDIKKVAKEVLDNIPKDQKTCLIFGGEPTVEVRGRGVGGRSQELVLRILKNTQKSKKLVIASLGTDGIDGNSVFAGAIAENIRMDPGVMKEFLKNNDSGRFFQKQKGNILTGFTHANLMDIGVILR